MDWINDNTTYPYYSNFPYAPVMTGIDFSEYNYGWGIIDGYEMYQYFKQNY